MPFVLDPPSNIQITGPDYLLSTDDEYEPHNIFTCTTGESNPAATIDWIINANGETENIPEDSTATETINQGIGYQKISTLSLPAYQAERVRVSCIATVEDLDFRKSSEDLVLNFLGKISYK